MPADAASALPPVNEFWRPAPAPVIHTPPAKSTPKGLLALVLVVALLLAGAGYALHARSNALPSGTSAFVEGDGIVFSSPDGSYAAQFPEEPVVDSQPMTIESVTVSVSSATVRTDDYELAAASMTLPVSPPADEVNRLLEASLDGGAQRADADVVSRKRVTRGGLPGIDAKLKAPDGYEARALVMLSSSHLYVLFVHSKTGTDELFDAFDASFVVQPG
jgi:hypothetical protein